MRCEATPKAWSLGLASVGGGPSWRAGTAISFGRFIFFYSARQSNPGFRRKFTIWN